MVTWFSRAKCKDIISPQVGDLNENLELIIGRLCSRSRCKTAEYTVSFLLLYYRKMFRTDSDVTKVRISLAEPSSRSVL